MKLLEQANGNLPRTDEEKASMIVEAAKHYGNFLTALGFDWQKDQNSDDTPTRVAKAWVNDIVWGSVSEQPKITQFPSPNYQGMVFQGNIDVISLCSHHNMPFTGKAYVAYIPQDQGKVVGLSKLNRIVDWFSRRPQLQEALTQQVHNFIAEKISNNGVIVCIKANHTCCSNRGIGHDSTMMTTAPSGFFLENKDGCKDEFYQFINNLK